MITRYEIAAEHPDGRRFLIAYSPRVSRPGIMAALRGRTAEVMSTLGISDADALSFGTHPRPFAKVGSWVVRFTGRTQLDAKASPLQSVST